MPASSTDKFRKKRSNFSTTLNGGLGSSDATITLSSTSGLPTDTGITLTIDRVDANGVSTPTKMERVTGVVSGSQLLTVSRGVDNSPSAQSHLSGAVVEDIWDALSWNDHIDGVTAEHNQDGTHKNTLVSLLAAAQTFTAIKTFTTGLLKAADIIDTVNALKVIIFTGVASAVNQISLTNAAAGSNPKIAATGSDTNIALTLSGKGAKGVVPLNSLAPTTFAVTDATTIATDASLGNVATVTLGGSRTMGAPTNPTDGQVLEYELTQDGTGSRTITWNAAFNFGTTGAPTLTTTAGKIDRVSFRYSARNSKWNFSGSQLGF